MSTSLSNLVDNLSKGLHSDKCTDCKSRLDYISIKDNQLIFRCFRCKKNYQKDFNEELIKRFANTYKFCNKDLNKVILLLRKGVYPYEYMDNWERFDEALLPNKEAFYSNLNMKDITDADYSHANKVFKEFKLKHSGEYHGLYVQSDTSSLKDVLENFRNMCIEVYQLDPAHFLTTPGLEWKPCLKKGDVKLELLTDPDMLLMVEEGVRLGTFHAVHRNAKANKKYMKNYNEKEESSFLEYIDANILYGWAMSQKFPVGAFKWVRNVSRIDKDFIKKYDENSDIGYFLKVDIECSKELHDLHWDLPFLPERTKINKCSKLACHL